MFSFLSKRAIGLLRIGVCTVVTWAAPISLSSQTVSSDLKAAADASRSFLLLDDSLTRAADMLLAPQPEVTGPTTMEADERTSAPTDNMVPPSSRFMLHSGLTLAAARVELLRPLIEPILRSHGVPVNMAAVVVVESGGRATALSPKGARGLWQLMPDTARRYGLRVDEIHDDRLDLFKATDAAARYLHDLYAQFGDWKLALAAYNTGESHVGAAMLRAHTQDFDQLVNMRILPLETRNYVPRVLALAESLGQPSLLSKAHSTASAITVFAVSDH